MLAIPGTPGGIGYAAALSAVTQVMGDLAGQLFAQPSARMLARWLEHPLQPAAASTASTPIIARKDAWKDRQRAYQAKRLARAVQQQQRMDEAVVKVTMTGRGPEHQTVTYRPAAKRASPLASADMVSAAATAEIGRRASRQHTHSQWDVTSKRRATAVVPGAQGPVVWMAEVIRTLLTTPVCFTCTVDGAGGLAMYPFGLGRCRQFAVHEDDLSTDALVNVQYLALAADTWTNAAASSNSATGTDEVLVAATEANEAFDLAMDRIALVGALCKHVVHCGQAWPVVQQVLEAAVMAAAASDDAVAAGYHESLVTLARDIRLDQPPRPHFSPAAQRAALLEKAAAAAIHGTATVDANTYFHAMQLWHTARCKHRTDVVQAPRR